MRGERRKLVGKQFGKLLILSHIARRYKSKGNAHWLCVCSCDGKQVVVSSKSLFDVVLPPSCGCSVRDAKRLRMTKSDSAFKQVLSYYKSGCAAGRELEWALSDDDARKLFIGDCVYCGDGPGMLKCSVGGDEFKHNGIDREDSNLGYITSNVVSCCKRCNYAKGTMSTSEFRDWNIRIYKYWASK